MHHSRPLGLAALALAALAPTAARAQTPPLVQDGGFEAANPGPHAAGFAGGTFSAPLGDGWTATQGTCYVFDEASLPGLAHSGQQGLGLTALYGATDAVSQTLATTAGRGYTLSFFAANDNRAATFSAQFGGQTFALPVPAYGTGAANYSFFSLDVAATSASTALTFTGYDPGFNAAPGATNYGIRLDDVRVTPTAPVPETSSLVSTGLLLALGGLVAARKCATFKKQSQ